MPKDDEIQTVKVEFVTPERGPKPNPVDVVKQLVDRRVAEIMANQEAWLFQPFLQTKRVSDEMRRMQSVPEQRKWGLYFEKWGCVSCGTKDHPHAACGFCTRCYVRTSERLQRILKATGRRSETPDFDMRDEIETAQRALTEAPKALPAPTQARRRKTPRSIATAELVQIHNDCHPHAKEVTDTEGETARALAEAPKTRPTRSEAQRTKKP